MIRQITEIVNSISPPVRPQKSLTNAEDSDIIIGRSKDSRYLMV